LLGVYGIALMFSDVPRQVTLALSTRIVLPAASKLIDLPRPELRAKMLRYRKRLLLLLTAGMVILVALGDVLILFLYDKRYSEAAWMLPILALGIWPRLLCTTIDASLIAVGEMRYTTVGNFLRLVVTAGGILLGFKLLGPVGAVIAVALNDVLYYASINLGLHREGIGCLWQDFKVTALLLAGVAAIGIGRVILGVPFFGWDKLAAFMAAPH
jgi:O-antigen/teichoic acid export membrane protein